MTLFSQSAFILAASNPRDHVVPHALFGTDWFTNHMMLSILAGVLVIGIFSLVSARIRAKDDTTEAYVTTGRVAQLFEVMCVFVREQIARPQLGKLTDKYIYYIWTVFFFILFCNLLGMIPFGALAALLTGNQGLAHLTGTATSNLSVTGALATVSFIAIVGIGIREQGMAYFKHFAPVPFNPWPMAPLALFLIVLEVMGLLIKCVVLAMRLFGTMLAGHLALAVLLGLIFTYNIGVAGYLLGAGVIVGATAISLLEVFIALIQAFIFTFLTVIFIAAGAAHHDEHHGDEHHTESETTHGFEPAAHAAA